MAATLAAPGTALAAQPPTILSAGINAANRLYVTWTLGPGTTYDQAQFATDPALEPDAPYMFDLDNLLGYECGTDEEDCPSTPALTSYTMTSPVPRDRRYYAMVSAEEGSRHLASAIWVIDEAKPSIPGQPPEITDPPEGEGLLDAIPAIGLLLPGSSGAPATADAVAGRGLQPTISVTKPPTKIGAVLSRGIRVNVTCSGPCVGQAQLLLNGQRLARRSISPPGAGTFKYTVRPAGAARKRLRSRRRARLKLQVTVTPADGIAQRLSKSFTVRR